MHTSRSGLAPWLCGIVLLLGCLLLPAASQAQSPSETADSTAASAATADSMAAHDAGESRWLLLPFAAYAPETKLSGGIVAGWYESPQGGRAPSNVQGGVTVTQRRQLILQIAPEWYVRNHRWRLNGTLLVSRFPDAFFGIGGDTPADAEEAFTTRRIQWDAAAQRAMGPDWRLGGRLVGHLSRVSDADAGGQIATGAVPGAGGTTVLGVGPALFADTRDDLYFPTHGTFVDLAVLGHSALWGSDATFVRLLSDLRGYRSLGATVFAGNLYSEAVTGTVPFEVLPQLGGSTYMRGYRQGRYRDRVYWTAQAEARLPLFWRFRMAAFANVGEVGPRLGGDLLDAVQAAAGLGGRFRLTDNGVYARADLAYGASGFQLYLSLGEAF